MPVMQFSAKPPWYTSPSFQVYVPSPWIDPSAKSPSYTLPVPLSTARPWPVNRPSLSSGPSYSSTNTASSAASSASDGGGGAVGPMSSMRAPLPPLGPWGEGATPNPARCESSLRSDRRTRMRTSDEGRRTDAENDPARPA